MAFNPFSAFRKHQKFWMASLVLLAMIVFVFDKVFTNYTSGGGGGGRGNAVATINGTAYYDRDLRRLKTQRNVANEYMHRVLNLSYEKLKEQMQKEPGQAAAAGKQGSNVLGAMADVYDAKKPTRYFQGGDKIDDLIDFILWQQQADKLGVRLEDKELLGEVAFAVHARAAKVYIEELQAIMDRVGAAQNPQLSAADVLEALRQEYRVRIARVALLGSRPYALLGGGRMDLVQRMQVRLPLTPEQLWEFYSKNRTPMDIALLPVPAEKFMDKVKTPDPATLRVEVEDLYAKYKDLRDDPASPVPGFTEPEKIKVTWLRADPTSGFYRKTARLVSTLEATPPAPWSPALPGLGEALTYAGRAAAWRASLQRNYEHVRLNPDGRYYDLPLTAPYSVLYLVTRLFDEPAPEVLRAWQQYEERRYASGLLAEQLPLSAPALYQPKAPKIVAAVVGGMVGSGTQPAGWLTAPSLYQAAAYQERGKKLAPIARAEAERRVPVGATLLLSGSSPLAAFQTAALWVEAERQPEFLPFDAVEPRLRKNMEHDNLARPWAQAVMEDVRKVLEPLGRNGNGPGMAVELAKLREKYGGVTAGGKEYPALEEHSSTGLRTQYDIAEDPALRGLREAFEKWRDEVNKAAGWQEGTGRTLKPDDFYKLFFGEDNEISVKNAKDYELRFWPPRRLTPPKDQVVFGADRRLIGVPQAQAENPEPVNLWVRADGPIIYWKSQYVRDRGAPPLAEIRPRVESAWKLLRAREKALERARTVAEGLRKLTSQSAYLPDVERHAKALGIKPIILREVTALVPKGRAQEVGPAYAPYELPPGLIAHPPEDMAKDLLALRWLKAPLRVKEEKLEYKKGSASLVQQLNDINRALFDRDLTRRQAGEVFLPVGKEPDKAGRLSQVQILTDRARKVFYVAVVIHDYQADPKDFAEVWRSGAGRMGMVMPGHSLVNLAQDEAGREFEQQFVRDMRVQAGLSEDLHDLPADARKSFDEGGS
jgi:hypothetical protein